MTTDFRDLAGALRAELAKPIREEPMTEQDAVERVAKAICSWEVDAGYETVGLAVHHYGMATAAITAYNAWLRERATEADVVEAVKNATIMWGSRYVPVATLDALLGKEQTDDRG